MRIGHVTFGYRPIRGGAETYLEQLRLVLERVGGMRRWRGLPSIPRG
jgi:hypothetical protein